jgi:dTDP-4-dehydrorhamnose 3,5-epimerase
MIIKKIKTKLKNVLLLKLYCFKDFRGQYIELYNKKHYENKGIKIKFVEDDISVSKKNVLRGIHSDSKAWKLISCLYGKIYLVIVNCDQNSKNFGKWQAFILSDENRFQVLVPPKHGVAHLVLSELAVFHYKQSEYYDPKRQATYKWDDPRFKIKWPIKNPILSERDKVGHYVSI